MTSTKKGIPKRRLPEGLMGVIKKGKIKYMHKDLMLVETRQNGTYILRKENSKIFNHPTGFFDQSSKVLCCFHGQGKELYYHYKICNLENTKVYYEEK